MGNQISKGWLSKVMVALRSGVWIHHQCPFISSILIHFYPFDLDLAPLFGRLRWQEGLILYSAAWLAGGEELAGLVRILNLSSNIGYWWILLCSHIGLAINIYIYNLMLSIFFVLSISTNPDKKRERHGTQLSAEEFLDPHGVKYLRA